MNPFYFKGLFGIAFGRPRSAFNTQKVYLKKLKSSRLVKELKRAFKGKKKKKSLKITQKHFWQKL
jgi:hypothetical protein